MKSFHVKSVLIYEFRERERSKEPTKREMTATYLAEVHSTLIQLISQPFRSFNYNANPMLGRHC